MRNEVRDINVARIPPILSADILDCRTGKAVRLEWNSARSSCASDISACAEITLPLRPQLAFGIGAASRYQQTQIAQELCARFHNRLRLIDYATARPPLPGTLTPRGQTAHSGLFRPESSPAPALRGPAKAHRIIQWLRCGQRSGGGRILRRAFQKGRLVLIDDVLRRLNIGNCQPDWWKYHTKGLPDQLV